MTDTTTDTTADTGPSPAIQLIANVVVTDGDGHVLLARYDPSAELDDGDADARWWLPAHELVAYEHPDDAARLALDRIGGLHVDTVALARVQSFRGRRGWHVSFDYAATASGQPSGSVPARWFPLDDLPPTMHGNWERDTIDGVAASRAER